MENYWLSKEVNFGRIKKNSSKVIRFQATYNIPEIKDITASCGCTKMKYNSETKTLEVVYKSGEIPKQITGNTQDITKYIHVHYMDGTKDELKIVGIKTRF